METFQYYKGYGIRYFMGTTQVEYNGTVYKVFKGMGEIAGRYEAVKYIHHLEGL